MCNRDGCMFPQLDHGEPLPAVSGAMPQEPSPLKPCPFCGAQPITHQVSDYSVMCSIGCTSWITRERWQGQVDALPAPPSDEVAREMQAFMDSFDFEGDGVKNAHRAMFAVSGERLRGWAKRLRERSASQVATSKEKD